MQPKKRVQILKEVRKWQRQEGIWEAVRLEVKLGAEDSIFLNVIGAVHITEQGLKNEFTECIESTNT